jgi:transposase
MPTTLGDVSIKEREAIVKDLLNVNLSVEDITEKYGISSKVIYLIANRARLDMQARSRIIKKMAQRRELDRIIDMEIRQLKSSVKMEI